MHLPTIIIAGAPLAKPMRGNKSRPTGRRTRRRCAGGGTRSSLSLLHGPRTQLKDEPHELERPALGSHVEREKAVIRLLHQGSRKCFHEKPDKILLRFPTDRHVQRKLPNVGPFLKGLRILVDKVPGHRHRDIPASRMMQQKPPIAVPLPKDQPRIVHKDLDTRAWSHAVVRIRTLSSSACEWTAK